MFDLNENKESFFNELDKIIARETRIILEDIEGRKSNNIDCFKYNIEFIEKYFIDYFDGFALHKQKNYRFVTIKPNVSQNRTSSTSSTSSSGVSSESGSGSGPESESGSGPGPGSEPGLKPKPKVKVITMNEGNGGDAEVTSVKALEKEAKGAKGSLKTRLLQWLREMKIRRGKKGEKGEKGVDGKSESELTTKKKNY